MRIVLVLSALSLGAAGQSLSLKEAVQQALGHHPSIDAASAKMKASDAQVEQARSGYLPRVQYTEMYMNGNNPVYVFGSLLTQRQFTAANFALDKLNRPDPLNNFQSQVSAEQLIYDFGGRKNGVKAAEAAKKMTEAEKKTLEQSLIARVARAYHGVTLANEALNVAREALKSAEADQKRAETVLAAGMATDADVLSVKVHVAGMKEQVIRREADWTVAKAALNEALGLNLDSDHALTTVLAPVEAKPAQGLESGAAQARPELAQIRLAKEAAEAQAAGAKSGYWPQIFAKGVFEADRQEFVTKGGANYLVMAGLRWNLFDGNTTKQRVAEAKAMAASAQASERQYATAVQLETRKAKADLDAATQRIAVTEATVAQAEESLRILRNRYSSGLATVTDVLRAETSVLDAKTRRLSAIYDQRLAAVELQRAAGILNGDSDVLN